MSYMIQGWLNTLKRHNVSTKIRFELINISHHLRNRPLAQKKKKRRLSKNKINRPLAERISKNILDSNFLIYRGRGEGSQNTLKSMEE
jgi:hypothetical protein